VVAVDLVRLEATAAAELEVLTTITELLVPQILEEVVVVHIGYLPSQALVDLVS
jgi:hypothetical protein